MKSNENEVLTAVYKTDVGNLQITCKGNAVIGILLTEKPQRRQKGSYAETVYAQIREYLNGQRKEFNLNTEFDTHGFSERVWREISKIPYGETVSYSEIAGRMGNPSAVRAVGSACRRNPIVIVVPCHRVIGKNGNIMGYVNGVEMKRRLLNIEMKHRLFNIEQGFYGNE